MVRSVSEAAGRGKASLHRPWNKGSCPMKALSYFPRAISLFPIEKLSKRRSLNVETSAHAGSCKGAARCAPAPSTPSLLKHRRPHHPMVHGTPSTSPRHPENEVARIRNCKSLDGGTPQSSKLVHKTEDSKFCGRLYFVNFQSHWNRAFCTLLGLWPT